MITGFAGNKYGSSTDGVLVYRLHLPFDSKCMAFPVYSIPVSYIGTKLNDDILTNICTINYFPILYRLPFVMTPNGTGYGLQNIDRYTTFNGIKSPGATFNKTSYTNCDVNLYNTNIPLSTNYGSLSSVCYEYNTPYFEPSVFSGQFVFEAKYLSTSSGTKTYNALILKHPRISLNCFQGQIHIVPSATDEDYSYIYVNYITRVKLDGTLYFENLLTDGLTNSLVSINTLSCQRSFIYDVPMIAKYNFNNKSKVLVSILSSSCPALDLNDKFNSDWSGGSDGHWNRRAIQSTDTPTDCSSLNSLLQGYHIPISRRCCSTTYVDNQDSKILCFTVYDPLKDVCDFIISTYTLDANDINLPATSARYNLKSLLSKKCFPNIKSVNKISVERINDKFLVAISVDIGISNVDVRTLIFSISVLDLTSITFVKYVFGGFTDLRVVR